MKKKKKQQKKPLTIEEDKSFHERNISYICKKKFSIDDKKQYKIRDHYYYSGKYGRVAHDIDSLRYKTPK